MPPRKKKLNLQQQQQQQQQQPPSTRDKKKLHKTHIESQYFEISTNSNKLPFSELKLQNHTRPI